MMWKSKSERHSIYLSPYKLKFSIIKSLWCDRSTLNYIRTHFLELEKVYIWVQKATHLLLFACSLLLIVVYLRITTDGDGTVTLQSLAYADRYRPFHNKSFVLLFLFAALGMLSRHHVVFNLFLNVLLQNLGWWTSNVDNTDIHGYQLREFKVFSL